MASARPGFTALHHGDACGGKRTRHWIEGHRGFVSAGEIAAVEEGEGQVVGDAEFAQLVFAERLILGNCVFHFGLPAVAAADAVVFEQDGEIALCGVIVWIELDGGAISIGCALPVAAGAQLAANKIVLENFSKSSLGERRVWFELDGEARFSAGGLPMPA